MTGGEICAGELTPADVILELDNVGCVPGDWNNCWIRVHLAIILQTNGSGPRKHERRFANDGGSAALELERLARWCAALPTVEVPAA